MCIGTQWNTSTKSDILTKDNDQQQINKPNNFTKTEERLVFMATQYDHCHHIEYKLYMQSVRKLKLYNTITTSILRNKARDEGS